MTAGERALRKTLLLVAGAALAGMSVAAPLSAREARPSAGAADDSTSARLEAESVESAPVALLAEAAPSDVVRVAASRHAADACRYRDPEDGACYSTADAADRAWLERANPRRSAAVPPANRAADGAAASGSADPDGRHSPNAAASMSAASSGAAVLISRTSTADGELIVEDPDDPDSEDEDGGVLAPVDATVSGPSAKPSFWQNLAHGLKGLVVRKADSKPASLPPDDLAHLFAAEFPIPLAHFSKEKLRDSFNAARGRHRRHHAIDLPAVRGTPVLAVVDGVIERMGRDRRGGKVVYLRDTTGRYTYYYAHLSVHEPGLRPGDRVARGEKLGEVGSTGRVFGGPHLHFAIFRTPENETSTPWRGLVVNPYLVFVSRVR